jgi:hypothetical protein
MNIATRTEQPETSLLLPLQRSGSYADCYTTQLPIAVTQAEYVEAFYTTRLFKAERLILRVLAFKPSTDQEVKDLAQGKKNSFAVWRVADRRPEQVLLTDRTGRTSSWLMAVPDQSISSGSTTRLYFGSAITGRTNAMTGKQEFSFVFHALLGLHDLYSRQLLQAAASKLLARRPKG